MWNLECRLRKAKTPFERFINKDEEISTQHNCFCRISPTNKISRHNHEAIDSICNIVGANYRSAMGAPSKADFISKMGIVLEEADESLYWQELLAESGLVTTDRLPDLSKEANEIVAMTVASIKTAKGKKSF